MKISAGVLIILRREKMLLGHPTNNSMLNCFSPPKGGINEGEDILSAAIRETKEEVGIDIHFSQISNINSPDIVDYKNKKGVIFKRVYFYHVFINSLKEIGLNFEIIDKSNLQMEEVDWAGFLTKEEAKIKIFYRFLPVLNDVL